MFGIGMGELMVILVVALIFVGPEKLPSAAKALGKGLRELRKAADNVKETVEKDEDMRGAIEQIRSVKRDLEGSLGELPSIAAPTGRRVGKDSRDVVAKLSGRAFAISKVAPELALPAPTAAETAPTPPALPPGDDKPST